MLITAAYACLGIVRRGGGFLPRGVAPRFNSLVCSRLSVFQGVFFEGNVIFVFLFYSKKKFFLQTIFLRHYEGGQKPVLALGRSSAEKKHDD